ncbi:MAG: indole-3-glycerol phosphate synthase TrpC [Deltaproteobacteria bacterium]|nr:indole-3-glycerol phosphate synthase TrpC [Deltaproteobacteria bacterium]
MSILDEILAHKREEVTAAKKEISADELRERVLAVDTPCRGFRAALCTGERPRIIAEVKRRSPSKGEIRPDFHPVICAQAFVKGGAATLSVLTDEKYFGGHLDYLREIRAAVDIPLLRKEFIVDPYQIDEARLAGADAVLLIVAALSDEDLRDLYLHGRLLGLDVLVEVHDQEELDRVPGEVDLLGINNRNLKTFETRLETSEALLDGISEDRVVVSESGIASYADICRLEKAGAKAFLVGESLMRQEDVCEALRSLRGKKS